MGLLQMFYQTRSSWGEFLTKLFYERFDVTVVHVSDMTTAAQMSFHSGYNARIKEHIDSIHSPGSVAKAFAEVQEFRRERYRQRFKTD